MTPRTLAGTLIALAACTAGHAPSPAPVDDGAATADSTLAADLQFLREEEKLARDVYLALYDTWQLMPHQRISSSEQTHMDRVRDALAALHVADPVTDETRGVFHDAQLAALYAQLVETGVASETAALAVGATIEDLDLRDIDRMTARTTDPTALATYAVLHCGSRNHLRAFTSQLAMRGASYTPQYVSPAQFDAILTNAHESCGQ